MAFEPGRDNKIRDVPFDQQKWTECRSLAPGARQRGPVIYDIVSSSQICVGFGELTNERKIPAQILKKARAQAADIVPADQIRTVRTFRLAQTCGVNASGKRKRRPAVTNSSSSSSSADDGSCSSSSSLEMLAGRPPAKRGCGGGRAH